MEWQRSNSYYRKMRPEQTEFSWRDFARIAANFCIMVAIGTIVFSIQVKTRPTVMVTYYTTDPLDDHRGGKDYTCGCILPTSLMGPEDMAPASSADKRNISLNVCYDVSSLETVTIVMYSNSSKAKVELILKESTSSFNERTVEGGGYKVIQEAHDITVTNDITGTDSKDSKDIFNYPISSLSTEDGKAFGALNLGGYAETDLIAETEFMLSGEFRDFPTSYLRLSFTYSCNDCNLCGLDKVKKIISNVVHDVEVWAECFYLATDINPSCKSSPEYNKYEGKCLLYPPETLPFIFAVKNFLYGFIRLPGNTIHNFTIPSPVYNNESLRWDETSQTFQQAIVWQPSFLYLNISKFEKSSIQFGFVEVAPGSALWVSLATTFPNLNTQCSGVQHQQVCSGTSLCNLFSKVESYHLSYMDMKNKSACQEIMNNTRLDHYRDHTADSKQLSSSNWNDIECRNFACRNVSGYKVIWNMSTNVEDDALNQFLYSRIQNEEWAQRSGLCKMTYTHVFRYVLERSNTTMFLHTNCTWNKKKDTTGTSRLNNTGGYCWLTGDYNFFNDTPEDLPKQLGGDLFSELDLSFVCYRVQTRGFFVWFIVTFGIVFGWLGTVQLILSWLFFHTPTFHRLKSRFTRLFSKDNADSDGKSPDSVTSSGSVSQEGLDGTYA